VLTAKQVAGKLASGNHLDRRGLYLQVTGSARSWLFRFRANGKADVMGLGSIDLVTLAQARELAEAARKLARTGVNPREARDRAKAEATAASTLNTFREVADAYMAAHAGTWRNAKHAAQWSSTLATYAHPVMGDIGVARIGTAEVTRALEPIWRVKPETASRVRGRIESVLDYATALGWRTGDNPARWRGHLDQLLPSRAKLAKVEHHAALPWTDMGPFMAALAGQVGTAAMALRFTILTAARTSEVTGATWREVDLAAAVWTIPGDRMKAGQEHRVPLSGPALAILHRMAEAGTTPDGFVFPGGKPRSGLSNMAMASVLRRMERADLTVHGFRSAFRDWTAETTAYPREVAEAALAHTLRDKVEAAYRRGDLLDKRRALMAAWAEHCACVAPVTADVVPLRARSASAHTNGGAANPANPANPRRGCATA